MQRQTSGSPQPPLSIAHTYSPYGTTRTSKYCVRLYSVYSCSHPWPSSTGCLAMSTFLSDSSSPEDASFGQEEKEYTGVKKMPVHIDQYCIFFPPLFPSFPLEKLCKNVECIKHQHAHTPFDKKPCYTTFNCVRLYILCAAALKELGTLSPNLRNAPLRKLHTNYFRRIRWMEAHGSRCVPQETLA